MLETIKTIGAYAGLVTAAFVVWDRWARGRPLAWVTATKFGAAPYEYIRVKNPGAGAVFIWRVDVHPPIYGIAKDHSAQAIAGTLVDGDVHVLLEPGQAHDLGDHLIAAISLKSLKTRQRSVSTCSFIGAKPARAGCGSFRSQL